MQFSKSAKTFDQQITLLKERGLKIKDTNHARDTLSNISYYRLSAYFISFQKFKDSTHTFMEWATFEDVMTLYTFDRELRAIFLDVIERIEVALRCRIVYEYCHTFGNNWYENKNLFSTGHEYFMEKLKDEIKTPKEVFINHYKKKYTSPSNPPAWMTLEILTFGQLSTMFKNLKHNSSKKQVANYFGVDTKVLESWMEHLVYIRNLCAHHSRLWNRTMTIKCVIPKNPSYRWISVPIGKPEKIYTSLCVVSYLIERVSTRAPFAGRLRHLVHKFPDVKIKSAGFPQGWESDNFWKSLYVYPTFKIRLFYYKTRNKLIKRSN